MSKSKRRERYTTVATLLSIMCGVTMGLYLKNFSPQPWSDRQIMYLQFPGELFLRMVNCLILPLIISSIISASYNLSKSGTVGIKALYYYITTTTLGIVLSLILSQTIQPGKVYPVKQEPEQNIETSNQHVTIDILLDLLRNLIPENIVNACLAQFQTELISDGSKNASAYELPISYRYVTGTNVLGLVFFSIILGLALGSIESEKNVFLDCCSTLSKATMMIMDCVIMTAPIGIFFLIPGKILEIDHFGAMMAQLGIYVMTVFAGLLIHSLITLPMLYFLCTRKSPFKLLSQIGPALITAFGTSSSTATVPVTIRCLDKIGIDSRVSRFVVPIGATINMDGIALYETIGAMFIIQMRGLEFSLMKSVALSITCTLSCIGAAGLPNGGYVMLIMFLKSIGVPAEDVTLIIAIDSFVDRFRTLINIVADVLGSGIIQHFCKHDLEKLTKDEERQLMKR